MLRVQVIQANPEVRASHDKANLGNIHKSWARLRKALQTVLTWRSQVLDQASVEHTLAHCQISCAIQKYKTAKEIATDQELFEKEGIQVLRGGSTSVARRDTE